MKKIRILFTAVALFGFVSLSGHDASAYTVNCFGSMCNIITTGNDTFTTIRWVGLVPIPWTVATSVTANFWIDAGWWCPGTYCQCTVTATTIDGWIDQGNFCASNPDTYNCLRIYNNARLQVVNPSGGEFTGGNPPWLQWGPYPLDPTDWWAQFYKEGVFFTITTTNGPPPLLIRGRIQVFNLSQPEYNKLIYTQWVPIS